MISRAWDDSKGNKQAGIPVIRVYAETVLLHCID